MGAVFLPAVLTGARRSLNLVAARPIRCLAGEPAMFHTESEAEEATTEIRIPTLT